jgi:hypothetical protein
MAEFIEGWGFFTRWLSILAIGTPAAAVLSCLAAYHFARRQRARFEFTDALLFAVVGGVLGPTLGSGVALSLGLLGPEFPTLSRAGGLLVNTALLGLIFGLAFGVPLGLLAAWANVRRGPAPPHQRNRLQNSTNEVSRKRAH